jgi:hypothetical protein
MPIKVEWDDEAHTVIHETYSGTWTIEDNRAERERVLSMLEGDGPMVDMIVELDNMKFPATIVSHFSELSRSPASRHSRLGVFALVGLGSFENTLFQIFSKVYEVQARRLILSKSVEEARKMLAGRRTD